ncbi:MAG TPA: DUF2336 domain-containing protein [Rhizomicrobium sp.]|nr:DUF2336 domain-containing protein [Rhizomicrobium sp.]
MSAPTAKDRLRHLIELAQSEEPADRRTLAGALCDLLLDWPQNYPANMREPFEALLEKAARDVDAQTRRALAERLAPFRAAPMTLLNELFFDAPAEAKSFILARNAENEAAEPATNTAPAQGDEQNLVALMRKARDDNFTRAFAKLLGVETGTATRILHEQSGEALAVACKGAHLARSTFSTLALLNAPNDDATADAKYARLAAYDAVSQDAAERMVRFWRAHFAQNSASARVA